MSHHSGNLESIPVNGIELEGVLAVPDGAPGIVVFAHGSGSSHKSPRNNFVAEVIREHGIGTLLFDLLTEKEDRVRENRFDIPLLTDRLLSVSDWLADREPAANTQLGYFGSSTGAAAALRAAARRDAGVNAVVSRGGRVDLAEAALGDVTAPTLLLVGEEDPAVLARNRDALDDLPRETELYVVPGAGHLFQGRGELEEVAEVAADWFETHLRSEPRQTTG